jgi:hypothetical protein
LAPYSSFAPSGGVSYSLSPLKVRVQDWETARNAIAVTPSGAAVLAPEAVAVWIPTFVHRPPIVSVRDVYDEEMGVRMPPDESRERRELRELVSGQELPPERMEALLSALPRYRVGLILATTAAASRLQDALADHGYSRTHEEDGYVFFASATPTEDWTSRTIQWRCRLGLIALGQMPSIVDQVRRIGTEHGDNGLARIRTHQKKK